MKGPPSANRLRLTVQYDSDSDEGEPPSPRAVRRTLKAALTAPANLTVRFVSLREAQALNHRFRKKAHATNVLAFEASADRGLVRGDIAVCPAVVEREARSAVRPVAAHYAHMLVHAALHLCGLGHDNPVRASRMEQAERKAMASLGLPDPYRDS